MSELQFSLIPPGAIGKHRHFLRQCEGLQNALNGENIEQTGREMLARTVRRIEDNKCFHFVLTNAQFEVIAFAKLSFSHLSNQFQKFWNLDHLATSVWLNPRCVEVLSLCIDKSKMQASADIEATCAELLKRLFALGIPSLHQVSVNRMAIACDVPMAQKILKLPYPRKILYGCGRFSGINRIGFRILPADVCDES